MLMSRHNDPYALNRSISQGRSDDLQTCWGHADHFKISLNIVIFADSILISFIGSYFVPKYRNKIF